MDVDNPSASSSRPRPLAASKLGRSPGKAHHSSKTPTRRTFISPSLKTPFAKRKRLETKRDAIKGVEKELKDEKEADRVRRAEAIRDRRKRAEEKKRDEELRAKMSAKRLQRLKKRQGRSKKING